MTLGPFLRSSAREAAGSRSRRAAPSAAAATSTFILRRSQPGHSARRAACIRPRPPRRAPPRPRRAVVRARPLQPPGRDQLPRGERGGVKGGVAPSGREGAAPAGAVGRLPRCPSLGSRGAANQERDGAVIGGPGGGGGAEWAGLPGWCRPMGASGGL